MPHKTRPLTALLVFTGVNALLLPTLGPVYDFVCFLPYWERRVRFFFEVYCSCSVLSSVAFFIFSLVDAGFTQRECRRQEREAASAGTVGSA
ncbi:hypothetical protein SASPL_102674 [Salvia splendens]|uniref:Uncharacterized protein n=1 Tax=Salvia splendens TaxID=180675 RepID=A0A8X8YWM8_SALSN|nr:hypothetical protein SASPL_102674 [Salvia splendens]